MKGIQPMHARAILLLASIITVSGCASTTTGSLGGSTASLSPTASRSSTTTDSSPEPETTYTPKPGDFKIAVKVRKKECFGSAGCNITYRINPSYNGPEELKGSWSVTYEVHGGEDGPQVNTFTLEDGEASFDSEEMISTSSSKKKLTAKATDVSSEG